MALGLNKKAIAAKPTGRTAEREFSVSHAGRWSSVIIILSRALARAVALSYSAH
jgi:hypothetical protein